MSEELDESWGKSGLNLEYCFLNLKQLPKKHLEGHKEIQKNRQCFWVLLSNDYSRSWVSRL